MGWIRRDSAWQQPFLVVPGSQPQGLSVWITLRPSSGLCAFRWVGTPRNQKRHKRPSFYWAFEALGSTKTGYFVESMLCMYECIIIYNDIYIYISYFYIVLYYTRKLKVYFTKCPSFVGQVPQGVKGKAPKGNASTLLAEQARLERNIIFTRLTWPPKWDISDIPPFFRHTNII